MKGSQWGSREVRNRVADGKVEVLGKLMREGLDEKLDLWLEIGHFQIFPIEGFLPADQGYVPQSSELRRSSAHSGIYVSMKHTRRVIAAHDMGAALLEGVVGSRGLKKSARPSQSCRVYFSVPDPRLGFRRAIFSEVTCLYLFRIIQHISYTCTNGGYLPYQRTARPTLEAPAAPTPAAAA